MLKRSLQVVILAALGIVLGIMGTALLNWRLPRAEAATPSLDGRAEPLAARAPATVEIRTQAAQDPAAQNGGVKVGLVNLRQCFDESRYAYAKDVTEQLKKIEDEIMKPLNAAVAEMKRLGDDINTLDKNNTLYQEKARKYKLLEMQVKLDKELGRAKFISEYSQRKLEVYKEITEVLARYGKDKKYDFILRAEEPQLEDDSPASVSQQIAQRVVLYYGSTFDITEDVLKLLNAEYAKRKAGGVPPAVVNRVCSDDTCKRETTDVKCPKCGKETKPKP